MQVLSIMPLSTAGINNRQMKSNKNVAPTVHNQNIGDTLTMTNSKPAFEGLLKVKGGLPSLLSNMKEAGLCINTVDKVERSFSKLRKLLENEPINGLVSSKYSNGKVSIRFDLKTSGKTVKDDNAYGHGYATHRDNANDPIVLQGNTKSAKQINDELMSTLKGLINSHNSCRRNKRIG